MDGRFSWFRERGCKATIATMKKHGIMGTAACPREVVRYAITPDFMAFFRTSIITTTKSATKPIMAAAA